MHITVSSLPLAHLKPRITMKNVGSESTLNFKFYRLILPLSNKNPTCSELGSEKMGLCGESISLETSGQGVPFIV
jgi:hypothetical protein